LSRLVGVETGYEQGIERLRSASRVEHAAPAQMSAYLDTVRRQAYLVADEDVEALLAAGISQDEIFEQTVAAAVDAGLDRLDAALRMLR
jgi:hypothetical protein